MKMIHSQSPSPRSLVKTQNKTKHSTQSPRFSSSEAINSVTLTNPQTQQTLWPYDVAVVNVSAFKNRANKLKPGARNMIECINLTKMYKLAGEGEEVAAVKNITLAQNTEFSPIKQGEFVVIRGPSGGGKTTFLNIIGTIDLATSGRIFIRGEELEEGCKDSKLSKLRLQKIGIVFQSYNLLALMTALQNVELPMRLRGSLSEPQIKKRAHRLLEKVGLGERVDHLPSELSGGQQQRVAIARALSNSPEILLLDEPTGDLDSRSTVEVMNLLLEINNFGYQGAEDRPVTMVMVTHNDDLECYADRVLFFEDGKIKEQVFNDYQFALDADEYSSYLNTKL